MVRQDIFDFAQLDAEAAHLHLLIQPPEKL